MINLVMLTGFLGAGKTTLLKRILDEFRDTKVAVIINEFGDINIDAKLVKKNGVEIAELSNGSIFCACIKDKFVDALIDLNSRDIEYLFIEASGLADPSNIGDILKGVSHKLKKGYNYKGAICITDALTVMNLYELLPAITAQIEFSENVIINKTDLVDDEVKDEIKKMIRSHNKEANIFLTSFCDVDIRKIVESMKYMEEESKESSNTVASRATTFDIRVLKEVPLENLKEFLNQVSTNSYRIKGFVNTNEGLKEVSCVSNEIQINDWNEKDVETGLVYISSVGIKCMGTLTKGIEDAGLKGILRV